MNCAGSAIEPACYLLFKIIQSLYNFGKSVTITEVNDNNI